MQTLHKYKAIKKYSQYLRFYYGRKYKITIEALRIREKEKGGGEGTRRKLHITWLIDYR